MSHSDKYAESVRKAQAQARRLKEQQDRLQAKAAKDQERRDAAQRLADELKARRMGARRGRLEREHPQPAGRNKAAEERSTRGSELVSCGSGCGGTGRIGSGRHAYTCPGCGGTGKQWRRKS